MKPTLSIVVAVGIVKGENANGEYPIGINNQLPWRVPADLRRFKEITSGHHLIMGRKTFESIGKPLPNRVSVIVSRNADYPIGEEYRESCRVTSSIEEALEVCCGQKEVFVIGGAEIYRQTINLCDQIYLTRLIYDSKNYPLAHPFEGDTFFPEIKEGEEWQVTEKGDEMPDREIKKFIGKNSRKARVTIAKIYYQFVTYKRK